MKTKKLISVIFWAMLLCFGISTALSLRSAGQLLRTNNHENALIFAGEISAAVKDIFSESKAVSETINNPFIRALERNSRELSREERSGILKEYLSELKERFGYDTAFLTFEKDYEYYTEWGYSKTVDPADPDDDWFERFRDSKADFELNVDNDQANDNRITIYINFRMEDEAGRFIGVCGVGRSLDDVNLLVQKLEQERELSIQMVSADGKIQVAGDPALQGSTADPEVTELIRQFETTRSASDYLYRRTGRGGYQVLGYIGDCRWYLFLDHEGSGYKEYAQVILDNFFAFALLLLVLGAIVLIFARLNRKNEELQTVASVDRLSGVGNRRAYEDKLAEYKDLQRLRKLSVFVVDLNGLKNLNDSFGHAAGDEAIEHTAACLTACFSPAGSVFRTGGDEFIVLTEQQTEDPVALIKSFKEKLSSYSSAAGNPLTASVGAASGNWDDCSSYEDLVKTADRKMYLDKERYYSTAENDRRRR